MNSRKGIHNEEWWRKLIWLFPATYLVHIAEEHFVSGGFSVWASHLTGLEFTAQKFLAVNGVALVIMAFLSAVIFFKSELSWIVATFGTIVGLNGVAHVAATIVTRSYSPGTLSGLILWIPLGISALCGSRRWLRPVVFVTAVIVGVACLGIVAGVVAV